MNKLSKLLWPLVVGITTTSNLVAAQPNDANSVASCLYSERLQEMLDTTGWHFESAVDTKQIVKEFRTNQAKAKIEFSKPGIYHGRISKVVVDNLGTYFIVDQGLDTAVTVMLDKYQASRWKVLHAEAEIGGVQSALEFAANINENQQMYFQCRNVEFGLGVYLTHCLVFPSAVTRAKSAPKLKNRIDATEHLEDLIKARASEGWARPRSTRQNMEVTLKIDIANDGTIIFVEITKSSGDAQYDRSVVATIKNIGRLTEARSMKPNDRENYRSFKMSFAPDDLAF